MSNLLFNNDDDGMAGQFFVPSPVPVVPVIPVNPQAVSAVPNSAPSFGHPPLPSYMNTPAQIAAMPQTAPPPIGTPPQFSNLGPPPMGNYKPSAATSRYAPTPGIALVGSNPSYSPQNASQSRPPSMGVTPPINPGYRSPHTYNPLPPVSQPPVNLSPQMTPVLPPSGPAVPSDYIPQPTQMAAEPAQPKIYWFYENPAKESESEVWLPFSKIDSKKLEDSFNDGSVDPITVSGGRYIADLVNGLKTPVYWTEDFEVKIRRGGWYSSSGGGFQPLSEMTSEMIDMNYDQGRFPCKFDVSEGVVMIHNAQMAVLLPPGCVPDQYGVVPDGQPMPRVIKHSVVEEDLGRAVPVDEPDGVACALILVACGGSSGEKSVTNVDSFRSRILEMRRAHFSHKQKVDVIPVHWHEAHTEQAQGAMHGLQDLTLPSVQRLRDFTNNAMMDVMFYSSPVYAQPMVEAVALQFENMLELYKEKNPNFNGQIAIVGHGISSLVIFDILSNQGNIQDEEAEKAKSELSLEPKSVSEAGISSFSVNEEETLEGLLTKMSIETILPKLEAEEVDLASLLILDEADFKDLGVPLGPRKKLLKYIAEKSREKENVPEPVHIPEISAETEIGNLNLEEGMTVNVQYKQFDNGAGQPFISYPRLSFEPSAFFGVGAPIGLILAVRGVEALGEEYNLPTCPKFLNIFHPMDPFAYRLEPFINTESCPKPVQIPHHKGRKRLHLEIADNLGKAAAEVKAGLMRSMKSVMSTVKKAYGWDEEENQKQADQITNEMFQSQERSTRRASEASVNSEEVEIGKLNSGDRIDYQLQERPLEMFNEYMFAFQSHRCYWTSEDAALLILKQIYVTKPVLPPGGNFVTMD